MLSMLGMGPWISAVCQTMSVEILHQLRPWRRDHYYVASICRKSPGLHRRKLAKARSGEEERNEYKHVSQNEKPKITRWWVRKMVNHLPLEATGAGVIVAGILPTAFDPVCRLQLGEPLKTTLGDCWAARTRGKYLGILPTSTKPSRGTKDTCHEGIHRYWSRPGRARMTQINEYRTEDTMRI